MATLRQEKLFHVVIGSGDGDNENCSEDIKNVKADSVEKAIDKLNLKADQFVVSADLLGVIDKE